MASPAQSSHSRPRATYSQRYRRSSFNGAKQLQAAQKPRQLVLLAVGLLVVALLAAAVTIAFHFIDG